MTPYRAQRIRYGLLAARHEGERWRLTDDQADYLDCSELMGWKVRDSKEAYKHEWKSINRRRS